MKLSALTKVTLTTILLLLSTDYASAAGNLTRETITFRGIPFNKPGIYESLLSLCLADNKYDKKKCDTNRDRDIGYQLFMKYGSFLNP
jgi:hypothetical protein